MSVKEKGYHNFFIQNTIAKFKKITRKISFLKIGFVFLLFIEIFLSWFFMTHFPYSLKIAITIGLIVLTIFSFFVILFYLQTKIPRQLMDLKNRFISSCKKLLFSPIGSLDHHLSLAKNLMHLSFYFTDLEYSYFSKNFSWISSFFHKTDVYKMREDLLFLAIFEHLKNIKNNPTDLELHMSLSRSYTSLANLYKEILKKSKRKQSFLKENIESATKHAIEEFKILRSLAPNDPWILSQIAKSYNSLDMLEEEEKAYENLLELCPEDNEILFSLGKIYFKLGKSAKGLKVYEELKNVGYEKSEDLLNSYSSFESIKELQDRWV